MKKFIIAIVFALMSITALGQIVKTNTGFDMHIGDYVFKCEDRHVYNKDMFKFGVFKCEFGTFEEAKEVGMFIENNISNFQKKYDIVFYDSGVAYPIDKNRTIGGVYIVLFGAQSREYHIESEIYKAKKERKEKQERDARLNSLNYIF